MSKLLGNLIKYNSYTSELVMMTNYLSVAICAQTDWASDSSLQKLSMAAIFQDLSLQDDNMAKIAHDDDPQYKNLSEDVKKIILNHPVKSVSLIGEVKSIADVANNIKEVVLNHHERPYGKGFPRKLSTEHLSGLSCVFIMAHEFSHRLLAEKLNIDILQKIASDFEKTYSDSHFRKPYEAFKKVFQKKYIIN
jgi:response regulator RpfG family c-di-GMP phosphodiesterase